MPRAIVAALILLFLSCTTALCATITVTNTNDSGAGSLRQAISDASSGDTINFSVTGTITLTTGDLAIAENLTISGPGAENLAIDGNASDRIFTIASGYTINISDLTIANGYADPWGGGIENEATLNLTDCVVENCSANGKGNGYGGGLDNCGGTVTITRCTFRNNTATNEGGAIAGYSGSITIIDSTIEKNTSDNGGGISQYNAATLTLNRCTVSGNHATAGSSKNGGGIICKAGSLTLTNCTISGNDADNGGGIKDGTSAASTINIVNCTIVNNTAVDRGGGIEFNETTANIKNTILAANTAPSGANFYDSESGGLNSQGYNLSDGTLAAFSGTGDQTGATLNMAALADNGGSIQTHELLSGSDAIDAIPEGGNAYNGAPPTDQRGASRPQGTHADVGAFEVYQAPAVTTQAASAISSTTATGNGTITGLGASNPTAHGVCWNTGGNPTTADSCTDEGGVSATGAFTTSITGLSPYTTYYVSAYATNSIGTGYGAQESFTTDPVLPSVTTQAVGSITSTTATANGNITALGIPNPTSHGVCWNTTGTPTTVDSLVNNGAASATGAFTGNLTSLSPNTTYYVRAFATNPGGTVYGNEVSFSTSAVSLSVSVSGPGNGQVSSNPGGIDCGADCSENYDLDTVVMLTAAPDDCSVFSGWSGACSGTGSCVVTMDRSRSVTATFNWIDTDEDQQPDCEDTDDDNDGMPDDWEIENNLAPLDPDDAHLDPDHDGLDNLGEYLNGSSPEEQTEGPGIPVLVSPEDGAIDVPLPPELTTDYVDPGLSFTHYATRWQIAADPLFENILLDSVSDINLTAVSVPRLVIGIGETCYFRVCYHDDKDIAWMWSDTRSFTVTSDSFVDLDGNGIPDDQDVPEGTMIDLDGDGINDPEQVGMKCVRLSDDETIICYQCTENIGQMDIFRRMDDTAAQLEADSGLKLPFGLFGFRADLENQDHPAVVTVFSSKSFAVNSRWFKYDSVNGHRDFSDHAQFSPDMRSVRLTFTDGSPGDADGCANGVIVDPSGPEESANTDNPGSTGSGGGGCFIRSVF